MDRQWWTSTRAVALLLAVLLTVVAAVGVVAFGKPAQPPASLRVRELVVVDSTGAARAVLGQQPGGMFGLRLLDRKGRERMVLNLMPGDAPMVALADKQSEPRAVLTLMPDDTPTFGLKDNDNRSSFEVSVLSNGYVLCCIFERDGKIVNLNPRSKR